MEDLEMDMRKMMMPNTALNLKVCGGLSWFARLKNERCSRIGHLQIRHAYSLAHTLTRPFTHLTIYTS